MTLFDQVRRRWRFARWIAGNGHWAVISECGPAPTISLFRTSAEAMRDLRYLHGHSCCELCIGRHRLIDLATEPEGLTDA